MTSYAFAHRDAGTPLLERFMTTLEPVEGDLAASTVACRALDELARHLEARATADIAALRRRLAGPRRAGAAAGDDEAAAAALVARLTAIAACAVEAADAKAAAVDTSYAQVDHAIKDLDRRARLLETLLREQGAAAGEHAAAADAALASRGIGRRTRNAHRVAAEGSDPAGDRGGAATLLAEVERRVEEAASQSAGVHMEPASAAEPVYCSCRQVRVVGRGAWAGWWPGLAHVPARSDMKGDAHVTLTGSVCQDRRVALSRVARPTTPC